MKKLFSSILFVSCFLVGTSGYGQEMPQGNLIVVTPCTMAHGVSVNDVIDAARAIDYQSNENGPNLIFYRRPMTSPNAPADRLLRVVYWRDMAHWATGGGLGGGSAIEAGYLGSLLSCDNANRDFSMNYNVAGDGAYDGGDSDFTLVTARSCIVKEGMSMQDVFAGLSQLDQNNRQRRDNTTLQLSHRFAGPVDGIEVGRLITIRAVGEDPDGLARRIDAATQPEGTPADAPVEACLDSNMFASYVAFWRQ